jgi:hypothetical protein
MRRHLSLLAGLAVAVLPACGGDHQAVSASTTSTVAPTAAINWNAPAPTDVGRGWSIRDCEGDAPLVCVDRDGVPAGVLEIGRFPLNSLPDVVAAQQGSGDRAALDTQARVFLRDLSADRKEGCGLGYGIASAPVVHLRAADGPVVRYGFTGTGDDGSPSERIVQYAGIRGTTLVILTANAYDVGGCLPPEGTAFTSGLLAEFEPLLEAAVKASPFPSP